MNQPEKNEPKTWQEVAGNAIMAFWTLGIFVTAVWAFK